MKPLPKRGFALLLTLLLVVLVAASLAGIARFSMLKAVEAQDATEALQRRWAILSAQCTLAPRVPLLLEAAQASTQGKPSNNAFPAERRIVCRLADIEYELVVTDEQAKVNVNTLLRNSTPADTDR